MLVHSPRNLVYAKKLNRFSFYLAKEAKKYQDAESRQAILDDARAFKEIAKMLAKHNPVKAARLMFSLDRIAIDFMPIEIFHYLEDYYK